MFSELRLHKVDIVNCWFIGQCKNTKIKHNLEKVVFALTLPDFVTVNCFKVHKIP